MDTQRQFELNIVAQKIVRNLRSHSLDSELYGLEYMELSEEEEDYVCTVVFGILDNAAIPSKYRVVGGG